MMLYIFQRWEEMIKMKIMIKIWEKKLKWEKIAWNIVYLFNWRLIIDYSDFIIITVYQIEILFISSSPGNLLSLPLPQLSSTHLPSTMTAFAVILCFSQQQMLKHFINNFSIVILCEIHNCNWFGNTLKISIKIHELTDRRNYRRLLGVSCI